MRKVRGIKIGKDNVDKQENISNLILNANKSYEYEKRARPLSFRKALVISNKNLKLNPSINSNSFDSLLIQTVLDAK